ncbi:TPA: DNA translocase FtsK [Staphylococcus argenteus]|uniref:DNA translocase FtsK n=1 Tax=Staphylococcus argenteus TaxID=985002 RepID=UPI00178CC94E|nr:DNA translocase FtsK [Staphylococcus argenteus]MBE2121678.1 DNA translocase FtsK [Staphylococcus argenteus]
MSWFDKLFGEDNDSNDDLIHRKKKRRQESQNIENDHDSLLPQNNDIYSRPRGKFRFPMNVTFEGEEASQSKDFVSEEKEHYRRDYRKQDYDSSSQKRHRRRRNQTTEEQNQGGHRGNQNDSQQSIKYKNHTQYRTSKPGTYVSAINGIEHENKKPKSHTSFSNTATQHIKETKPDYHKESFKTSEVPSAIFGTMKPKKLENGRIPVSKTSEKVETNKQNVEKEISSTQSMQTQGVQEDKQNNTDTQQKKISQSTEQSKPNTKKSTPNFSKVDNTIKIENIYASQIVEEIRRERERKVLQKRRFKKALQQKREEHKNENQDTIQRAIDEMYAKQAERYIGESSLNDENQDKNINDETNYNDKQNLKNNSSNRDIDNYETDNHDEISSQESPYNYEEVNLNQVSTTKQLSDDDVTVTDVTTQQTQESIHDDTDGNQEKLVSHVDVNDSLNNKQEETQVTDANFYEVNNADARQIDETEIEEMSTEESEAHTNSNEIQETGKTEIPVNNIDKTVDNEIEIAPRHKKVSDNAHDINNNKLVDDSHNSSHINNNDAETDEKDLNRNIESSASSNQSHSNMEQQHSEQEVQANKKTENNSSFSKRPFNVVMTPSDKKRMMDRKKQSKVSVPELKPVTNKQNQNKPTSENVRTTTLRQETQEVKTNDSNSIDKESTNNVEHNQQITQKDFSNLNVTSDSENDNANINSTKTEEHLKQADTSHEESDIIDDANQRLEVSSPSSNSNITEENDNSHLNDSQEDIYEQDADIEPSTDNDIQLENQKEVSQSIDINEQDVQPQQNNDTNKADQNANNSASDSNQQQESSNESAQVVKPMIRKGPNIKLPSVSLLEQPQVIEPNEDWIADKKQELNDALYYFNVPAEVQDVTEGPSVTRFELSVEKGVKVSRITALQDDIKMALAAKDIRIEAPIPGTSRVGIEVPNQNPTTVNLRSIIESSSFKNAESKLTVAMGYRINNEPLLMDIAKTPHALIAGATGSGKSVCINSILMSLLYKNHPEELRLLLIDPKMVELAPYNGLPHLVAPVITDVKAATQSLKWAVEEMERRYKLFAHYHVRNITAFNKKAPYDERMPKIVIVIDELADLMMMAPQEVEQSIARIAQKARACGIHMLVATQRPSVNVITGLIKANIPTRIAFMVSSSVDSRTILDSGGAERLLGYGDMLYLGSGMNKPIRVQGTFVSDDEIDDVVEFIKQQREPDYLFEEKELLKKTQTQSQDDLFDDVCEFMVREGHISTSLIQRHFQIGYNRAARIIDQLEQLGYVSSANGSKPRDVYVTEADLNKE